jgi:hypothetical protein
MYAAALGFLVVARRLRDPLPSSAASRLAIFTARRQCTTCTTCYTPHATVQVQV